jgi:hypothetical protein
VRHNRYGQDVALIELQVAAIAIRQFVVLVRKSFQILSVI